MDDDQYRDLDAVDIAEQRSALILQVGADLMTAMRRLNDLQKLPAPGAEVDPRDVAIALHHVEDAILRLAYGHPKH